MNKDDKNIESGSGGDKKIGLFSEDFKKWRKKEKRDKKENKVKQKKAENQGIDGDRPIKARAKWSRKSKVLFIVLCSVLGVFIIGGVLLLTFFNNPLGSLDTVADQMQIVPTPTTQETGLPDRPDDTEATPEPTLNPYEELMAYADTSILEKTINIMLIGTDYAVERETWGGKHEYHADVMIVLSINTETNAVNMISLPRDTYAKIPGVDGIYKLNASINCGGGWPTEGGFKKVCEAAAWMVGIPSIDYYYAVDMAAVKGLVDAIGGLDYDLDISFDNQGREYEAGFQHMDGQAVLDYLRVRKAEHIVQSGQSSDLKRIDRQKRMLIAIFKKIKESNLLANIPKIIEAFDGGLYTNLTTMQTAGLVSFAYNIDPEDIGMYSMSGKYKNIFNWLFVITNQTNRKDIIEEVYGFRPKARSEYDEESAMWLWENMQLEKILEESEPVITQVKAVLDEDAQRPKEPEPEPPPTATPTPDPSVTPDPNASPTPTIAPTPEPTVPPGGYRKYDDSVYEFYSKVEEEYFALLTWDLSVNDDDLTDEIIEALSKANTQFKTDVEKLCGMFNITVPKWKVTYEKDDNEIYVDFR